MVGYSYRKGDGSGLQSWHRVQTVPLRCSTVCRGNREKHDLIHVGSNPTGENRCLVVKAVNRHLPSVHRKEEDMESAGRAFSRREAGWSIIPSAARRKGSEAGDAPAPP